MHFSHSTVATLVAMLPAYTLAQTFTDCDPTKKTCTPDVGLSSSTLSSDFTKGESASWKPADGTSLKYGVDGAEYTITQAGQAPTVGSDFSIFYGRVDVVMKAASGTGIVSSIVLESDVLDEIDWEFLGGRPNQVQSNYYGLANTTTYDRVGYHQVADVQANFHTYTIDWSPERIQFIIDNSLIRTVERASTQGRNYPQTPMHIKLGNWAAGGPGMAQGTVEWAGGKTNFDDAPFSMVVKSVTITNTNPACSYVYSDRTASDSSIKVITTGDSCKNGEAADSKPTSSKPIFSATNTASSKASSASKTNTKASTLTQTVANIVPTGAVNTTVETSLTRTPSASVGSFATHKTSSGSFATHKTSSCTGSFATHKTTSSIGSFATHKTSSSNGSFTSHRGSFTTQKPSTTKASTVTQKPSTTHATSTTVEPSAQLSSTSANDATFAQSTVASYMGGAALNSVGGGMSLLAVAAGLWVM